MPEACPQCGAQVVAREGCWTCRECAWAACADGGDDLQQRIANLEGKLQAERNRREDLEALVDELRDAIVDLREENEQLRERIAPLERTYETLGGIADDAETSAEARERDLLIALERKARDRGDGTWAMDYEDIKDALSAFGHGDLDDKQAYRLMDPDRGLPAKVAACSQGVKDGNKAVKLSLDDRQSPGAEWERSDAVNNDTPGQGRLSAGVNQPTNQHANTTD